MKRTTSHSILWTWNPNLLLQILLRACRQIYAKCLTAYQDVRSLVQASEIKCMDCAKYQQTFDTIAGADFNTKFTLPAFSMCLITRYLGLDLTISDHSNTRLKDKEIWRKNAAYLNFSHFLNDKRTYTFTLCLCNSFMTSQNIFPLETELNVTTTLNSKEANGYF